MSPDAQEEDTIELLQAAVKEYFSGIEASPLLRVTSQHEQHDDPVPTKKCTAVDPAQAALEILNNLDTDPKAYPSHHELHDGTLEVLYNELERIFRETGDLGLLYLAEDSVEESQDAAEDTQASIEEPGVSEAKECDQTLEIPKSEVESYFQQATDGEQPLELDMIKLTRLKTKP